MAEREMNLLLEQHLASGQKKSFLKLSNNFPVEFESLQCSDGCSAKFETIVVNGVKKLVLICKRPDGSIC